MSVLIYLLSVGFVLFKIEIETAVILSIVLAQSLARADLQHSACPGS